MTDPLPPPADLQLALRALQSDLHLCQRRLAMAQQALDDSRDALSDAGRALVQSQARELLAQRAAGRDALTGLANRIGFGQQAALTLTRHAALAQGFCLGFVDLDGFKAINDRLGHAAGDQLLRVVGERLAQAVRGEDRVGRYGGDEFVCLLPGVQRNAQAMAIGHKLLAAVALPCTIGSVTVQLQASLGLALYPQDGLTLEDLTDRADHAMLWAKAQRLGVGLSSLLPVSARVLAASASGNARHRTDTPAAPR